MSPPAEDLVRAVYRLSLVQRAIAREAAAELGSQGFVALAVVHRNAPMRLSDLGRLLSVDLSVASRQITALVTAGYVRRAPDPVDRRAQLLSLTERGDDVLAVAHGRLVDAFQDALDGWSVTEIETLATGLDRLREDFASSAAAPQTQEVAR